MPDITPFRAVIISNEIFQNHLLIGEQERNTQEPDDPIFRFRMRRQN